MIFDHDTARIKYSLYLLSDLNLINQLNCQVTLVAEGKSLWHIKINSLEDLVTPKTTRK